MTESEAFDCGAYARIVKIGRSMCPNDKDGRLRYSWLKGYKEAGAYNQAQKDELKRRKGIPTRKGESS